MTFPTLLGLGKKLLVSLQVEHLIRVADATETLGFELEGFGEGIMHDPDVVLHGVPHLRRPLLDRQVATVRVREPNGLSSEIVVQVRLLGVFQPELCGLQLGYHVVEDVGGRVEEEDAGVEAGGEPRIAHVNVWDGSELEREVPDLVKVSADDGVRVEVDAGLYPELV